MHLNHIIKPTHKCNLNCKYCFSEDERNPIMNFATLERVIMQTFQLCLNYSSEHEDSSVDFIWHGGEPMLAGLGYYHKVIEYQRKYSAGIEYKNCIQTNGILINEEWAKYFKENDFSVSVSIDGPKELNDLCRITCDGNGTFDLVMEKIDLLKKFRVPVGACAVLSQKTKGKENLLYEFFSTNKLPFELIPVTYSGNAVENYNELNLKPEELADIWIKIFDKWYFAKEEDRIYCMGFACRLASLVGGVSVDCLGCENCNMDNISTDPEGYVYPCVAFSSMAEWRYGNINEHNLATLMNSEASEKMKHRKMDNKCIECKWCKICYGGCPSRALMFFNTINAKDYYCPSLYKIYEHIGGILQQNAAIEELKEL